MARIQELQDIYVDPDNPGAIGPEVTAALQLYEEVDERKLYQTFLGAKNSIQEHTVGLKMVLFDFEIGKWSDLIENMTLDFPSWSNDGQYVYFLHSPENLAVLRIRVRDRKIEQVADLKGFVPTGWWGKWFGTISRAH